MTELSFPAAFSQSLSYSETYRAVAEQDGFFFGAAFLRSFLEESQAPLKIVWYVEDGEGFLKGQTLLAAFAPKRFSGLKGAVESISYLSGASSLARCYAESGFRFSAAGAPSKNSPFPEWEIRALRQGGAAAAPPLPSKMVSTEEDLEAALDSRLDSRQEIIALNGSKIPFSELKAFMGQIPRGVQRGVYGAFLPKDLERLDGLPVDFVWPALLQGGFPRAKISLRTN